MELDSKLSGLVAVGASIGANCRPCLQSSIALAVKNGAEQWEIGAAIAVGRTVRRCATRLAALADEPAGPGGGEAHRCCASGGAGVREGV